MFDLKGIIPPLVTPFDQTGAVRYDCFERNLDKYFEAGIDGFLVGGSTGESVYLEHSEKLKLTEVARKRIPSSKMLLAGTHAGPQDRARFAHEAEAVAALRHPNIVQIHDFGTEGDITFIVMEYVDGGTLKDRLKKALPVAEAAARKGVSQSGLHQAIARGEVIARPVKPTNQPFVTAIP